MSATPSTVARYERARQSADAHGMDAKSRATMNAEAVSIGGRTRRSRRASHNWVDQLHRAERIAERERRPLRRSAADVEERRAAEWIRRQRDGWEALSAYQRARLQVSPSFSPDPRSERWGRSARLVREHIVATGSLPRWSRSDPAEYRLAQWWGEQVRANRRGRLGDERRVIVGRLIALSERAVLHRRNGGQFISRDISTTSPEAADESWHPLPRGS